MLIIDIIDFVETKTRSRRNIYHNIEIPRPKCHVIEITEPKNHDIEIQQLKHHNIEKRRQLSHNILIPRHFFRGQKAMTSRFQDWKTTTSRLQDQNATTLVFCGILTLMPPMISGVAFPIRGNKGQNSAEIWLFSLGISMLLLFVLWKKDVGSRCQGLLSLFLDTVLL